MLAAVKGSQKIAVEGKSFAGISDLTEFERALGQFNLYFLALQEAEPDRKLFLAVPQEFYADFLEDPFFQKVIQYYGLNVILFNEHQVEITSWIE